MRSTKHAQSELGTTGECSDNLAMSMEIRDMIKSTAKTIESANNRNDAIIFLSSTNSGKKLDDTGGMYDVMTIIGDPMEMHLLFGKLFTKFPQITGLVISAALAAQSGKFKDIMKDYDPGTMNEGF